MAEDNQPVPSPYLFQPTTSWLIRGYKKKVEDEKPKRRLRRPMAVKLKKEYTNESVISIGKKIQKGMSRNEWLLKG